MKECVPPHKILVAVDGSEQSLRAVRYTANVFSPDQTHVVLFNVRPKLFALFSDLDTYPHLKHRMVGIKRWATEQKVFINDTMKSALVYFKQKGFPESAITFKAPAENLGIAQDIVKESYDGYDAIVVGRTGLSRFKDWLVKSTAMKLVAKIKHIPIVVVGGNPDMENFLVAFDGTRGSMKGVVCVGALVGTSSHVLELYSIIDEDKKFWPGDDPSFRIDKCLSRIVTGKITIGERLEEARKRLLEDGFPTDRISLKIHAVGQDRAGHIVKEAMGSGIGSIVVGRRGMISFIEEYVVGRVSDQVLKLADQLAVWII